ncbi:hypothetical protein [Streptomyces sp. NPDC056160]|uniref:hypothetical protein n=1 Tax=Streptomyces sp. NPDC056160 TaxID=3345731 RepID=UPI0035DE42D6
MTCAVALLLIPVTVLGSGSPFREFLDFGAGVLSPAPRHAEAEALRAVRRCPALALRIEEDSRARAPSRNLPVLPPGRGRRALGR